MAKTKRRKKRKFSGKLLLRVLRRVLFSPNETPKKRAQSVALAAFMSFIPLYGLQTLIGVFLAFVFRLNKLLVAVLINIITPYPLVPLIIYFSFKVGGHFVTSPVIIEKNVRFSWELLRDNLWQYFIGGTLLAVVMAIVLGGVSYPMFVLLKMRKANKVSTDAVL